MLFASRRAAVRSSPGAPERSGQVGRRRVQLACPPPVVLEPAWVSYPEQVRLCHGVPVMVPHDRTVFQLDEFITPRTKAIIINNPNNPSGRVMRREQREHVHALADRHDLYVLADEAYSEFLVDDAFVSVGRWTRRSGTRWCATPCPRTTGCRGGASAT